MIATPSVNSANIFAQLAEPFQDDEIEWRVARAGIKQGRPWAQVLAYIDARAARARLNSVLGPTNWSIEYSDGPRGGVIAKLSLRVDGEWISKADGADITEREPVKGGLSSAFKRVCAVWGVGEHLYEVRDKWALFSESGAYRVQIDGATYRWDAPSIASNAPVSRREPAANDALSTAINARRRDDVASAPEEQGLTVESAASLPMPFGKHRGTALRDVPLADLRSARDWAIQKKRAYPEFLEAVALLERSEPVAA